MARENYVEVESIKNPSVKRLMNVNSFKMNQKKWRLQSGQTLEQALSTKKKDVEPVAKPVKAVEPEIPSNIDEDLIAKPETPFVKVGDETPSELETLRAAYKEKTGNEPDARWKAARLNKEINGN